MARRKTFSECFFEAIIEVITYLPKQIREICEKPAGYLKLAQLLIILFALGGFILLLLYTLFFNNEFINPDIFMTVIVGLIGTIVGMFFSESAMHQIEQEKKELEQNVKTKEIDMKSTLRLLDELDRKQHKFEDIISQHLKKYPSKKK